MISKIGKVANLRTFWICKLQDNLLKINYPLKIQTLKNKILKKMAYQLQQLKASQVKERNHQQLYIFRTLKLQTHNKNRYYARVKRKKRQRLEITWSMTKSNQYQLVKGKNTQHLCFITAKIRWAVICMEKLRLWVVMKTHR